ncbi:MAG: helix-turn-helix transcriptional regulator [Micromonosporaceae bacterium]
MATGNDAEWTVAAVAALDEPTRRRVYDHVAAQPAPVSRDAAADALGLPRSTAAFHLDQLVKVGLLDVAFARLTGRAGPGAGRPAKLYHRSQRQVAVSIPGRRYELAGRLLAAAIADAEESGASPRGALNEHARGLGKQLGEMARAEHTEAPVHQGAAVGDQDAGRQEADDRAIMLRILEEHGFEPRVEDSDLLLANCPFHALAQQHTELVCGMNLCLLQGLVEGLAVTGVQARLKPAHGQCCVRLEAEEPPGPHQVPESGPHEPAPPATNA